MKFIIQKDYLVQSVQDVMKAVSSRTTIPILTGIKIVATEEGVTLTREVIPISRLNRLFQTKKKEKRLLISKNQEALFSQLVSLVKSSKSFLKTL